MKTNEIILGDSYKLIKELPDKSIDCIYTDVPYKYDSGGGGSSELSKRIIKIDKTLEEANLVDGFDYSILDDYVRVMKKVNIIIWFSKLQMQHIMNYFLSLDREIYFEPLMWVKTNPTPATHNTWLPDVEYAFHFREKGVSLNDGYDIKSKWYMSPINKSDKDAYGHPTIKPLEVVKRHLLHITQPNDIVLDTFMGSGTTAEACILTGRRYIGYEISEEYYKICMDRLSGITKEERELLDRGQMSIFDYI
jgi:DNA modification methylase